LGEKPIDEDHTPAAVGLLDGETLHLRPRSDQLRPFDFDDLVDGVSSGIRERPDRWQPSTTRRLCLALAALAALIGVPMVGATGPPLLTDGAVPPACVALLLVAMGAAVARAFGDIPAGSVLGMVALPYAIIAGAEVAGHPRSLSDLLDSEHL